jgi:glycosyltransferase involved in cell wall biosynthesis
MVFENMNALPLVSVIVPCYNHEHYIAQCIESVLAQTYRNFELIVIDNGSTDNSRGIIATYAQKHSFKTIHLEKNLPPGVEDGAVGMAISLAKGEYISVLYSDDWFLPEKIEKQVALLLSKPRTV